jgi:hypothetical protein
MAIDVQVSRTVTFENKASFFSYPTTRGIFWSQIYLNTMQL